MHSEERDKEEKRRYELELVKCSWAPTGRHMLEEAGGSTATNGLTIKPGGNVKLTPASRTPRPFPGLNARRLPGEAEGKKDDDRSGTPGRA